MVNELNEFNQVADLNVDTAEFSPINFYRAWWFVNVFIKDRMPYEIQDYFCSKCKDRLSKGQTPQDKCYDREFTDLLNFYENVVIINDFLNRKIPYDVELSSDDIEANKEKFKEQKVCSKNFNNKLYYLSYLRKDC